MNIDIFKHFVLFFFFLDFHHSLISYCWIPNQTLWIMNKIRLYVCSNWCEQHVLFCHLNFNNCIRTQRNKIIFSPIIRKQATQTAFHTTVNWCPKIYIRCICIWLRIVFPVQPYLISFYPNTIIAIIICLTRSISYWL